MLTEELRIAIPGRPYTKGSMKCIGARGKVKHQLVEELGLPAKDFRDTVSRAVRRGWMTWIGEKGQALGVEVTFTIPRTANHFGAGRNAEVLKASAPIYPVGHNTGDIDKYARMALDAIQDTHVLPDDCQIIELTARKAYMRLRGEPDHPDDVLPYPGVVIRLYPIEDQ